VLDNKGIPSFSFSEWLSLEQSTELLVSGKSDAIDPAKFDLRHALNAAWLARVDRRRPADRDLTEPAMELAVRIMRAQKNNAPARAAGGGQGAPGIWRP